MADAAGGGVLGEVWAEQPEVAVVGASGRFADLNAPFAD